MNGSASGGMNTRSIRRKQSRKTESQAWKLIPPGLGKPLLFFLALAFLPLMIRLGVHEFVHKKKYPLQTGEWKFYSPGQSQLSLPLPSETQPESVKVSVLDSAIKQMEGHQVSVKEFRVRIWNISYQEGMSADLQQAVHNVAPALKEAGDVMEYQESVTPIRRSGRSGLLVSGAFKRKGEQNQFRALLLSEEPRLWQVVVSYPASDRAASKASQQIVDSVRVIEAKIAPKL